MTGVPIWVELEPNLFAQLEAHALVRRTSVASLLHSLGSHFVRTVPLPGGVTVMPVGPRVPRLRSERGYHTPIRSKLTPELMETITALYESGMSSAGISRRVGVSSTSVLAWLRQAGVPVRGQTGSRRF